MKMLVLVLAAVFCNTVNAVGNFNNDILKEYGIKLLAGERSISTLFIYSKSHVPQTLVTAIANDIELKYRLIGAEFVSYEWGTPYLALELSILDDGDGYYAGWLGLGFYMPATLDKNEIRTMVEVWGRGISVLNLRENHVRDVLKDHMDAFLADYLEANPRKFVE